ncbi:KAP family NTPase [Phocaeicola vulgatus]|uniref:P-loop NTPase fold protein n=1 Tax=Phocaeicola vulgatus TaxID=821 RepID=UPI001EDDB36D|nr:P-loop NTPase fold protein [Phocaeicola vulgatus]MCG4918697.1 KAP family NTPase [Phocaeicola vulgatus]
MNTLILDFLNSYADNPNPQYAVMLKGKWGCGKTHLIKQWKKRFDETADTDEEITLKPIYISTYGMDSVNDIKTTIDRELNPFFYSKTGRFIKGILKLAGKVVFKTSMDLNDNSKEDGSFSATLDSLSLLQVEDDSIKGVKFLIFDDIERCLIEMKELLGFINYFVEHCNCHVVVIGDENHLEELPKAVLGEFKEKTIGKEFEIQPDIEEAIEYFLDEVPVSDYLKEMRDFIIACFMCTKSDNLRILRQCLYDFKSHLNKLPSELIEKDNIFLKNILGSFIAVYAEYNNSENKELICNWSRDCQISLLQDDNEDKQRIQHLREKYHSLNKGLIYNVLNPEYVTAIIQYIITGAPLVEFIVTEIKDKQEELKPWEMLSGFFDMEQQKLESICQATIKAILDKEIKDAYQLGYSIAYLSYFDAISIFSDIKPHISSIKERIAEMINSQTSLEELYQLRGLFISGCNYVTTDVKTPITDDIVGYFLQQMKSKINELPDQMQKALRNLTEGTVEELIIIDRLPYPDKSCTYELRAIFASEDANALFDAICKLSNKGRNAFTQFLAYHYNFGYDQQDVGDRYKADIPCLLKLKDLVDNEISISKGVDKLAFIRLKDVLIEAIRRCEG